MPWQESDFRPEYCEIAAEVLSSGKSYAAVCSKLDICRSTLYKWRDDFPEFAKALSRGLQKAQEHWEDIGEDGIKGNIDKFSSTPWIFTMKNRFRDDYADEKKEDKTSADSLLEKILSGEIKIKHD